MFLPHIIQVVAAELESISAISVYGTPDTNSTNQVADNHVALYSIISISLASRSGVSNAANDNALITQLFEELRHIIF